MNEEMKVGIGQYNIVLTEEILARLQVLAECDYMADDLEKVVSKVIELYQGTYEFGDIISAEDSMRIISTLHEAKKDYRFITSLVVIKKSEGRA